MPRINKGLKQGLAGALALGAAAAVPTVMASSQAQQGLVPWQPGGGGGGGGGGCGGGSAATESAPPAAGGTAVAPPDWSLSRVLEQVLQQVRQLAVGGPQADEEAGSDEGEESWEDELPAADASDQASSLGPEAAVAAAAAAAAPSHAQQPQHAQQHGGRQRRRGRDFLSARRLAAEHPEDVRQLRQMTLDELTRLRAEDSSSSSSDSSSSAAATPVARRQQAQGRGGRQQAPQQLQAGEEAQQQQLPARLTDAELVRFAIMQGLLQAASPAERETKLREGAAAAARTALWLEQHPFSSDEELSRFAHLVRWEGPDAAGRPVLRILIGVAVTECRGNAALAFANAILTHMEQGVSSRLHDAPPQPEAASSSGSGSSTSPSLQFVISQPAEGHGLGQRGSGSGNGNSGGSTGGDCVVVEPPAASPEPAAAAASPPAAAHAAPMPHYSPEQVVVLMDCRGASTLNAARISWVFKAVASSLSHHYPGRLHELVLLDLPVVLSWMVKGVKQLVHPDTRGKFRVVHAGQQPAVQQAQQQHVGGDGPAAAVAAEQAPASQAEAPSAKPRWPRRWRQPRGGQAQQQQEPAEPASVGEQQGEQQAGKAAGEQQSEREALQEAAAPSQPEAAAPKLPHSLRQQRAGKRKQAAQEPAQDAGSSELDEQAPTAQQQAAPEPAAQQPARQRRRRGRLAEQQAAAESGQQEPAGAAPDSQQ